MNFDLPAITAEANPDFRDARSCATWLEGLPLINVGPSQGRLLGELEELNSCNIAAAERLQILELLREPILFVQTEHAKKFANRSIPLAKPEREVLLNILALWDAYAMGYMHCLQALSGVNRALMASSTQLALACQRALWCVSRKVIDYLRCYQEVPAREWQQLHSLYAFGEAEKLLDQQVEHPVNTDQWKTTGTEAYSLPLLLQLASPWEMTARQQALAARWLDRWGNNVRIRRTPAEAMGGITPIVVDITGRAGPDRAVGKWAPGTPAPAGLRHLDTSELGKSIRSRLALLQKGDSPEKLQLGEDVPAQMAEQQLKLLHRHWCEELPPRSPPRKPASGSAELCWGMLGIHYFVSGLAFRQPGQAKELSKTQREEIATFGRTSVRADDDYAQRHNLAIEQWRICDESLAGMRLERQSGEGRFNHAQMIAVRPADARSFAIATVRWLSMDGNYTLRAGLQLMPGVPQGVAIRATGVNAMADKYIPALMLSAVPALRSPESLVLPVGWYRPRRVIELFSDNSRQVLLTAVLERGADFERIAFTPA